MSCLLIQSDSIHISGHLGALSERESPSLYLHTACLLIQEYTMIQAGLFMSVNPVTHHLSHTCALARENESIEKTVRSGVVCAGVECALCFDWSRQCFMTAATILLFAIALSALILFCTLLYLHMCVMAQS